MNRGGVNNRHGHEVGAEELSDPRSARVSHQPRSRTNSALIKRRRRRPKARSSRSPRRSCWRRRGCDCLERLPDRALGRTAGASVRHLVEGPREVHAGVDARRPAAPLRQQHGLLVAGGICDGQPEARPDLRAALPARAPARVSRMARNGSAHQSERSPRPAVHAAIPCRGERTSGGARPSCVGCVRSRHRGTQTGDTYLRNTVLLATVLFLTALGMRFKVFGVRLALVGVSAVLLGVALYFVFTYPQA